MSKQRSYILIRVLLIIYIYGNSNGEKSIESCDPAEEFKDHQVHFLIPSNVNLRLDTTFMILEGDKKIGNCLVLIMICNSFQSDRLNISLREIEESRVLTLVIRNITRNIVSNKRSFYYSFLSPLKTREIAQCDITVFSKASGLSCTSDVSENGVSVLCSAKSIYPQGRCNFYIKDNFTNLSFTAGQIHQRNNLLVGSPRYYTTECNIILPKSSLTPGKFEIQVIMYPNVTNNEADFAYGTTVDLCLELQIPRITLLKCPQHVKEGTKVNCYCKLLSNNDAPVRVHWYNSSNVVIESSSTIIVHIKPNMEDINVFCQAVNILGWSSSQLFYQPNILSKAKNVTCNKDIFNGGVNLSCSGHTRYPEGKCHFQISLNKTTIDSMTNRHSFAELSGDQRAFITNCSAFIPKDRLLPGIYEAKVTIYPEVTHSDTENEYGAHVLYSFALENPSVQLEDCPENVFEEGEVICKCKAKKSNSLPLDIQWYNISGNIFHKSDTQVILLKSKQIAKGAFCHGINLFGWKSDLLLYKPNVLISPKLKNPSEDVPPKTIRVAFLTNVSITVDIYGYPKPTSYSIFKGGAHLIDFHNLTEGNGVSQGYQIKYRDDVIPHGRIFLTFAIDDARDFSDYLLIVDNGISPSLKYIFSIKEGTLNGMSTIISIIAICVVAFILMVVLIYVFLWRLLKKKDKINEVSSKASSENYYEEVELGYDVQNTSTFQPEVIGDSRLYDVINTSDESPCNLREGLENKYEIFQDKICQDIHQ